MNRSLPPEALRLVEERDKTRAAQFTAFRAEIDRRVASEEFFGQLEREEAALPRKRKTK